MSHSSKKFTKVSQSNLLLQYKKSKTILFKKEATSTIHNIKSTKKIGSSISDISNKKKLSHLSISIKNDKLFINPFDNSFIKNSGTEKHESNQSVFNPNSFISILQKEKPTTTILNTSKTLNRNNQVQSILESSNGTPTVKENLTNFILTNNISQCFICCNFFSNFKKTKLFSAIDCSHYFCKNCGKNYYEEQIELGKYDFKCPQFLCQKKVSVVDIKDLVSEIYFNQIERKNSSCRKENGIEREVYNNYLSNKHFIDIVNQDDIFFEEYLKMKTIICSRCGQPALFGRNCRDYVKCLNCLQMICKYCCKDYDDEHLNIRNENHCKVYFRSWKKRPKIQFDKQILAQLLFFIVGAIVVIIGFTKKIVSFYPFFFRKSIMSFFSYLFTLILVIFIFWIIFPIYPLILFFIG